MNSSIADLPEPHVAGEVVNFRFTNKKFGISASKEKRRSTRVRKFESELRLRDCFLFEGNEDRRGCIQVRDRKESQPQNTKYR